MAGAGSPYIKQEPIDFTFDTNQYAQFNQTYFNTSNGGMNINPANLSDPMSQSFNQGSMSASFNNVSSAIADDELLDLDFNQNRQQNNGYDFNQGMQHAFNQQQMNQAAVFSNTPDGAPIQSPFTHSDFNYAGFRSVPGQHFTGVQSMPQTSAFRHQMQSKATGSRPRAAANTPTMNQMQMSDDMAHHPGMQQIQRHRRQQGSGGAGWDSTPSGHSWNESSPFPSPASGRPFPHQIAEVMKTENNHQPKVASSLPAKMEGSGSPGPQTTDLKKKRRRESHNLVERRRRDNINERIQDLGHLLPQHRLEDEKVRKHLQTNAPLSPSITTARLSPPTAATASLASSHGRRTTGSGSITQGLPAEDKDKGPNKGDILNGSVAWTRDLMWYLERKMRQEQEAKQLVSQLGAVWPFEQDEEELRMESEITEVISRQQNGGHIKQYTRARGSGLRVPGFTNVAGETINSDGGNMNNPFQLGNHQQQALSPGFQSGGSGMSSGQMSHLNQTQFWDSQFNEEDEYGMEMH